MDGPPPHFQERFHNLSQQNLKVRKFSILSHLPKLATQQRVINLDFGAGFLKNVGLWP